MNEHEWIVCESSGRWTAALRATTARAHNTSPPPSLHETRSLSELATRLAERPHALCLLEVHSANLHDTLAFLADTRTMHPHARVVALLELSGDNDVAQLHVMSDALRAAGAVEVIDSPRHLHPVLPIGRRHAQLAARMDTHGRQSFAEWARASLPWQDTGRQIG